MLFVVTVGPLDLWVRFDDQAVCGTDGETHLEQGAARPGAHHLIHYRYRHQPQFWVLDSRHWTAENLSRRRNPWWVAFGRSADDLQPVGLREKDAAGNRSGECEGAATPPVDGLRKTGDMNTDLLVVGAGHHYGE